MSKILRQAIVPIAAVATPSTEVGRAPSPVSTPITVTSQPATDRAFARTQRGKNATGLASAVLGSVKLAALLLVLPLAACEEESLTQLLNGGSARASSSDRTSYIPGSTATQAEINRLQYFAPGQSTHAMHDVMGSPDSTTPAADYYYTPDRSSMVVVPYDAAGNWTGKIESVPAPEWQPAPYPGAQ